MTDEQMKKEIAEAMESAATGNTVYYTEEEAEEKMANYMNSFA